MSSHLSYQQQTRRFRVAKDRHGREWCTQIDTRTNYPADGIYPHNWTAPWLPDPQYVSLRNNDRDGSCSIVIDYARMKADLRQAEKEWGERLLQIGAQFGGQSFDPNNPAPDILFRVGPRPKSIRPVIAAENGDAWILGRPVSMPNWAVPLFVPPVDHEADFLKDAQVALDEVIADEMPKVRGSGRPRKHPFPVT